MVFFCLFVFEMKKKKGFSIDLTAVFLLILLKKKAQCMLLIKGLSFISFELGSEANV